MMYWCRYVFRYFVMHLHLYVFRYTRGSLCVGWFVIALVMYWCRSLFMYFFIYIFALGFFMFVFVCFVRYLVSSVLVL